MKINRTRERILDKSIELFNRKQASNVSTVQISDRTGNQPGKSVLLLHQQGRSDPLHLERTDGAGDHGRSWKQQRKSTIKKIWNSI